jgi:MYXO-CTERM domain-containing protein
MRLRLLIPSITLGISLAPAAWAGGFGCADMCVPSNTCADLGQGCNPFQNICQPCQNDEWCAPNGTCLPDGSCANVDCSATDGGVDAGLDAGSSTTTADAGAVDAGALDADVMDAGTSTTPRDAGFIDTGVAPENPNRNRSRATDTKEPYDEGCTCDAAAPRKGPGWSAGLGILLVGALARRQRRRAAMGPTRRSAKSSV